MRILWFRKKKEEPDAGLDEPTEKDTEAPEPEKPGKKERGAKETKFAAGIERLSAKLEALSELRKADAERFSRISEQIGELRNLILEKEEEIKEIGVKAAKAAELVEELKPESIMAEVRKGATKYDVLEAKIEAGNALYQKLLEELKESRKKLALFRGMEELIKLNDETSRNLAEIKRAEASIESHSNKVGNVYVHFQKQANELIRYHDAAAAMREEFKRLESNVESVKAKAQSALIDQSDLNKLKAELNKKIEQASSTSIESLQKDISGYLAQKKAAEQASAETIKKLKDDLENKDKELRSLKSKAAAKKNSEGNSALSEFEIETEELRRAIDGRNAHSAITLYNLARDSYFQLAGRLDIPKERKTLLRTQLIDMYRALSRLIKEEQRQP